MAAIIGKLGCYFMDFAALYGILLNQSTSLAVAIFRYICVVHQSFLLNHQTAVSVSKH